MSIKFFVVSFLYLHFNICNTESLVEIIDVKGKTHTNPERQRESERGGGLAETEGLTPFLLTTGSKLIIIA